LGDAEEGLAVEGVDPVVGGATQAEAFATDVAAGELAPFAGGLVAELLKAGDASEGEIG